MAKRDVGEYVCDEGTDLGEGSFGKVFRGHRKNDEKEMVAIKAINLKSSVVRRAGSITTEREVEIAEILTSTRHPNLILFHCHKKIMSIIYLVMEFCNGGNLNEYLQAQEGKTLSESTIRCFFKQIGAGLKFLHGRAIVHRDLKPENVLLSFDDGKPLKDDGPKYPTPENIRLKIGDFGLGRFLTPEGKAQTNCGTIYYKAPEVASQNYDHKVDLWSIGMMIYECIVGTVKAGASDIITLSQGTAQDLRELLKGLLEVNPQERFDCDRLLNHSFMLEIVQVSIHADGKTRLMRISKKSSVDELYKRASQVLNVCGQEDTIFLNFEGQPLERGSGSSVEDARIRNGSIIVLGYRQSGGIYIRNQTRISDGFCTSFNLL